MEIEFEVVETLKQIALDEEIKAWLNPVVQSLTNRTVC